MIMNYVNNFTSCLPQMAIHVIVILALAVVGAKLFGMSWDKIRKIAKKYWLVTLIAILILCLVIRPYKFLNLALKLIVVESFVVIIAIFYNKINGFGAWLEQFFARKREFENFWKHLLHSPVRVIALITIICTFCSSWADMILLCLIMIVLTDIFAKEDLLSEIDWQDNDLQKWVTIIMVAFAIGGLCNLLGFAKIIDAILTCLSIIVGVIVVIFLIATRKK